MLVSASGLQCAGLGDKLTANQSRSVLSPCRALTHTVRTQSPLLFDVTVSLVLRPSPVHISISVQLQSSCCVCDYNLIHMYISTGPVVEEVLISSLYILLGSL